MKIKIHALEGKIKNAEALSAPKSDTFEFDAKEEEKELIFTDAEQKKFYRHIGGKPAKPGKEKIDPFKDIIRTMLIIFEGKVEFHASKEKVGSVERVGSVWRCCYFEFLNSECGCVGLYGRCVRRD